MPPPSRRALLVGGAMSPLLAACPGPISPSLALTLFSVGMSALKHVGGVAGMPRLVQLASAGGRLADGIGFVLDLQPVFTALMRLAAPPPAVGRPPVLLAASPVTEAPGASLSPVSVAPEPCLDVFMGQATASLELRNDTDTEFLVHNVYSVVRRIDEPVPSQPWELTDASSEPTFAVSLPARRSEAFEQPLNLAPNNTYVLYAWCIPSDRDLDAQAVADYVTVGTPFYLAYEGDYGIVEAVRGVGDLRAAPTGNVYYWAS